MPDPKIKLPPGAELVDDSSSIKLPPGAELVQDTPDLTANEKGEGTYEMAGPGGKRVKIPFSMISTASQAGYKMTDADKERYEKDKKFQGQPNAASRFGASVADTLKGAAKGVVSFLDPRPSEDEKQRGLTTPYDTIMRYPERILTPNADLMTRATEEAKSGHYVDAAAHGAASLVPMLGPWAVQMGEQSGQQAAEGNYAGAAGTLVGNAIVAEAPKMGGKVIKGITKIPEKVTGSVRDFVGTESAEDIVTAVKKTNEVNIDNAEKTNKANTETHLSDTLDALQASRNFSNKEGFRADEHIVKQESARKKFNESELDRVRKEGEARLKVLEDNKEKEANYDADHKRITGENERNYRMEVERQNLETKLTSESKNLEKEYDTARSRGKRIYNATWNRWRNYIKNAKADMSGTVDTIRAQSATMNPQQVALFNDILRQFGEPDVDELNLNSRQAFGVDYDKLKDNQKAVIDKDIADRGGLSASTPKEVAATRLHGWKSQAERLVRNVQDGTVRHAVGQVLDSLRKEEGNVSASVGPQAVKQLANARAITGPYFDAFFKAESELPRVAEQSLREQTPEYIKERDAQKRLDNIAAYNPNLSVVASRVADIRKKLGGLTKEMKEPKNLPIPPTLKTAPEVVPPRSFEPKPFEPRPGSSQKLVPPDRPENVEAETTKAEIDDLIKAKEAAVRRGAKWIRYRGNWIATSAVIGTGMLYNGLHLNLTSAGYDVLAGGVALKITGKIADFLERPKVKKWLSQPTAEDIKVLKQLPPEQLGDLSKAWKPIIEKAEVNGIKVSPSLTDVLMGTAKTATATGAANSAAQKNKEGPKDLLRQAGDLQSQFQQSGLAP